MGTFSNSNSFDGDRTEWHPDVDEPHWHGIKFGFYLQPLDGSTGALRLIPGSHKEPLHSDLKSVEMMESNDGAKNGTGLSVEQVPAFHARSEPGDVVLFDNHTWHASYGGSKDRRMCTVGYFASPTTPEEVVAVRFGAEQSANLARTFPRLRRHPDWVANPGGSRVRQGWIDTLRRWGFLDDGES